MTGLKDNVFIQELKKDLEVREQDYRATAEKCRRENNPATKNNLKRQQDDLKSQIDKIKQSIETALEAQQGKAVQILIDCLMAAVQVEQALLDCISRAYWMARQQQLSIGTQPQTVAAIVNDLHSRNYTENEAFPVLHRFAMCLLVMQKLPVETVERLNQWVSDYVHDTMRLRAEIEQKLAVQAQKKACLLVKVFPSPKSPNRYYVTAWYLEDRESYRQQLLQSGQVGAKQVWLTDCDGFGDSDDALQVQSETADVSRKERKAIGESVLMSDRIQPTYAAAELEGIVRQLRLQCLQTYGKPDVIQVFLPTKLLNDALERWPVKPNRQRRLIGTDCEVIVGSIERLEQTWLYELGRDWHRKWDSVESAFANQAHGAFAAGDPTDIDALYGMLACDEVIATQLTQAVADAQIEEVLEMILLETATPLAIWLREALATLDCCGSLEDVLKAGSIKELPAVVKAKRAAGVGAGQTLHVGQGVVLLWDDPLCPPPDDAKSVLGVRAS